MIYQTLISAVTCGASKLSFILMKVLISLAWLFALSSAYAQTPIIFWHSNDVTEDIIISFAEEFNASQSLYEVLPSFAGTPQESAIKLVAALNSSQIPALYDADVTVFSKLQEEGSLKDLAIYTDALAPEMVNDFYPNLWRYGAFGSERYGLPWSYAISVIYYNKSIFDQLGVTPPTTWENFEAVAARLTTRNTKGYVDIAAAFIFETLVSTRGGRLVTEEGLPNFDSPEALEALTMLQRMAQERSSIPRGWAELDQGLVDFARTKGLMAIASEAFFPQGERFSVGFEVASTPIPGYVNGLPLLGSQLVVLKGASQEETDGAVAFWQFLVEPNNLKRWVEASYFLPTRQSVVPLLEPWYKENPYRQTGLSQLEFAISEPRVGDYVIWQGYLEEAIERATKTGMDPSEALKEAQRRALESR